MVEVLSRITSGDLAALLIVGTLALTVGVVGVASQIVAAFWRHREREVAAAVIANLLDRGLAPQEIIAVLQAMGLNAPPKRSTRGRLQKLTGAPAPQHEHSPEG